MPPTEPKVRIPSVSDGSGTADGVAVILAE